MNETSFKTRNYLVVVQNNNNKTKTKQQQNNMSSPTSTPSLKDELRCLGLTLLGKPPKKGASIKEQDRLFRAHYGAGWAVLAFLWKSLVYIEKEISNGEIQNNETMMKKKHLLWCLYFFKIYPTESVGARRMDCSPVTLRKWVRHFVREIAFLEPFFVSFWIKKLNRLLPFSCCSLIFPFCLWKIKLQKRYKGDKRNDCLLSVDTTDCRICELNPFEVGFSEQWSSHKFGKKSGLRYEVALSIRTGFICWCNGPFPSGVYNDWQIFNRFFWNYNINLVIKLFFKITIWYIQTSYCTSYSCLLYEFLCIMTVTCVGAFRLSTNISLYPRTKNC